MFVVLFRIRCTGGAASHDRKAQIQPALRHLLRHLRDDPDPLVLTSLT